MYLFKPFNTSLFIFSPAPISKKQFLRIFKFIFCYSNYSLSSSARHIHISVVSKQFLSLFTVSNMYIQRTSREWLHKGFPNVCTDVFAGWDISVSHGTRDVFFLMLRLIFSIIPLNIYWLPWSHISCSKADWPFQTVVPMILNWVLMSFKTSLATNALLSLTVNFVI